MQQTVPRRELLAAVVQGLAEAPVVALLGARQVGKTTLAEQVASAWPGPVTVFDLEVAAMREALTATPERLLGAGEGLVVIDEVQRMPALFECTDAPRTTKSMRTVIEDLRLAHLWVLYPGDRQYPLGDTITALPLKKIHELELPAQLSDQRSSGSRTRRT